MGSQLISRQRFRTQALTIATRAAFVAALLCWQPATFYASQAQASNASLDAFPFVVRCEVKGFNHYFYLSRVGQDGVALYITPGNQAGTITVDGTAKRIVSGVSGSCAGKTLQQLRSAGQTYDVRH